MLHRNLTIALVLLSSIFVGCNSGTPANDGPVSSNRPQYGGRADDVSLKQWPNWRGPLDSGESPYGKPPLEWDEKTNVRWKVALPGRGSSTPVIWGDRVFVAAALDTGRVAKPQEVPKVEPKNERKTQAPSTFYQFMLICLDRATGKENWRRTLNERVPHEGHHQSHSYAAGSPTTDGKLVWVSFGSHGVYCCDLDGALKWQRDDLPRLFTRYGWGEASTPVVHDSSLILNWDQETGSRLYVLDALTGATRWQVERDEPTTWNTPLVVTHEGITQIIINGTNKARSYDLKTAKVLWECGGQTINAIPSPVAADGVAILMSGYRGACAVAVPLSARGDITNTSTVLWKAVKGTPYVPSPLLVDGRLYFTQTNSNLLTCLDARTGKPYFERERLDAVGDFYGSPVAAAGRIYLTDRSGKTLVLKQATRVEVLAENTLEDEIDASPAVVGRQLFLRGHHFLYCLEE